MAAPRSAPAIALALALSAIGAPAAAQPSPAEVAFNQGLTDMQAGHYDTGCPALEESQRLDPRPGTLFTLAECEAKRGRIATAVARYRDYLALFDAMKPEQKSRQGERPKIAAGQKAALEPKIPTLTLTLPPDAPPGIVIKRDGAVVDAAALGVALAIDPGEHVISSQVAGAPASERRISLMPSDRKQILIEAKTGLAAPEPVTPPPPPPVAPQDHGPSGQRVSAYVAGGLGIFGLVLAGFTGGITLGKRNVIEKNCVGTLCNHEGELAAESAKTMGLISTVSFAAGLAGVGTGAVLFFTEPRASMAARGRPSRVGGVGAGVLAAGPAGAVLGLRGQW